jgi:hypothetical protein
MTPTMTTLAVREHIHDLHRHAERSRRAAAIQAGRPAFARLLARRAARLAAAIAATAPVPRWSVRRGVAS